MTVQYNNTYTVLNKTNILTPSLSLSMILMATYGEYLQRTFLKASQNSSWDNSIS